MPTHVRTSMKLRAERQKPLLVSREDAAALLSMSTEGIDKLIERGTLQIVKLGLRRVGVKMSSVELVADRGVNA